VWARNVMHALRLRSLPKKKKTRMGPPSLIRKNQEEADSLSAQNKEMGWTISSRQLQIAPGPLLHVLL
jgi:hypothetical protein